jgi:predicted nucleotidyltransferase
LPYAGAKRVAGEVEGFEEKSIFHHYVRNLMLTFASQRITSMKLIDNNMPMIIALCKKHKVNKLFVFGSILTNRFNDESDIDLTVDFNKAEVIDYFDNYFDFKYSLEELLGRKVDLLEEQTIKNPYLRKNVDATKSLIYG